MPGTSGHSKQRPLEGIAAVRDRYVNSTAATIVPTRLGEIRFSNVPLLREIEGVSQQAVRVRVPSSTLSESLTLRISYHGRAVDEQTVHAVDVPQSILLFVPEVVTNQATEVEVFAGDELLGVMDFEVTPQRKFTIHVVHHSHYDIGYTDPQSTVLESQLSFIDYALELATLTDEWPDDAKFRWNIEVTWPLKYWLRTRPRHAREALVRRIAEGRFEVHGLSFSMHTEAYSQDELAQQLSFTRELREDWGIDIVSAMQTDVPGITLSLASLLTDAGIKYLAVAHNYAGISVPFLRDGQELTRPFWWEAPDGERLLVWYTDTLIGDAYMEAMHVGFGSSHEDVVGSLPEYLNAVMQRGYPHGQAGNWMNLDLQGMNITKQPYPHDILHLRVQGAFADNASSSLLPATIIKEWNETWSWPKLRSSLGRDFFADVEDRIGDQLETYRGDWTDWWALGIGTAAFALGRNRQSQADIRTAQTLHALADIVTDDPLPSVTTDVEAAYEEMALFDEHTWGAANPWGREAVMFSSGAYQWTRKEAFAYNGEERTQLLLNGSLQRIAPLAAKASRDDRVDSLLVFNPSSWTRTDLARVFVPRHQLSLDAHELTLIDAETGERVAARFEEPENATHRPHGWIVRFVAEDIPPIGYRRYELIRNASPTSAEVKPSNQTVLDNMRLRVNVDPQSAAISGILDKSNNRELVDQSAPFAFNRHIYDRYASAPGFNHLSSRIGSGAGPWLLGSRKTGQYGLITSRETNDVWDRLTLRYEGDGVDWAETTLTLPQGTSRLHITNRLHKPVTMAKESLYYAFPFAGNNTRIDTEITGGVVGPDSPHVPGSADHFRTLRHWATITPDDAPPIAWATREAPLVMLGNIHLPYAPFPPTIAEWQARAGTIYSWALNNIWDTNFPPEQGGELIFSYVVGIGGDNARALGRDTGAAAAQPLVGVTAPVGSAALDVPDSGSFVTVEHPLIEVSHLAPARDGNGIVVFLFSGATETVTTTIQISYLEIKTAATGTFLQTGFAGADVDRGRVVVTIAPGELITLLLRLA